MSQALIVLGGRVDSGSSDTADSLLQLLVVSASTFIFVVSGFGKLGHISDSLYSSPLLSTPSRELGQAWENFSSASLFLEPLEPLELFST